MVIVNNWYVEIKSMYKPLEGLYHLRYNHKAEALCDGTIIVDTNNPITVEGIPPGKVCLNCRKHELLVGGSL